MYYSLFQIVVSLLPNNYLITMSAAANLPNPDAIQAKAEFTDNAQYDTFLKNKTKLEDDGVFSIKTISVLTMLLMFGNKTDN